MTRWLGLAVLLGAVISTRVLCLNLSPSAPRGVYHRAPVPTTLTRGMLVLLPAPASVQHLTGWAPLLKPVAGMPGDLVQMGGGELRINGEAYGPILTEAHGQSLPQWSGQWMVRDGEVFLASHAPRSLDGRYWFMTPVQDLTAQAIPLWTWR